MQYGCDLDFLERLETDEVYYPLMLFLDLKTDVGV